MKIFLLTGVILVSLPSLAGTPLDQASNCHSKTLSFVYKGLSPQGGNLGLVSRTKSVAGKNWEALALNSETDRDQNELYASADVLYRIISSKDLTKSKSKKSEHIIQFEFVSKEAAVNLKIKKGAQMTFACD